MNKKVLAVSVILVLLLCVSCSAVFESGLSGSVIDSDSRSGIAGVRVYAYTKERDRDNDYSAGITYAADAMRISFTPSLDSLYIPTTVTGANGNFTINKIVWKTLSPKFGKTADVMDIYLLFFHEDYGLYKADVQVVSDSSNQNAVYIELAPRMEDGSFTLDIVNDDFSDEYLNNQAGWAVDETVTVNFTANKTGVGINYIDEEYTVTGSAVIPYYYPAGEADSVQFNVNVTLQDNSRYSVDRLDPIDPASLVSTSRRAVYMVTSIYDMPVITGTVAINGTPADNEYIQIVLEQSTDGSSWTAMSGSGASTVTGHTGDGANGGLVIYGGFTLGSGLVYNKNYSYRLNIDGGARYVSLTLDPKSNTLNLGKII